MSDAEATVQLSELARQAAWGLVKGGHLDALEDGKATLLLRLDILEAAASAGITIGLEHEGIGVIYTRDELTGLD
ncbi:hypothetical protein A0W34_32155 (plasmid) [Rhodococcus sp. BH4]|uniref:hypothetical protein n=1 Tax=Rhodococcus sp. BH4 TaxID=1807790 RepID=UPI0009C23DDB|nr:hypothetical protein [Rhodococcus sp. BH4]ARE38127.1 hypothetical protein A0W34_32155 [Rhodococcus sp. BH4]